MPLTFSVAPWAAIARPSTSASLDSRFVSSATRAPPDRLRPASTTRLSALQPAHDLVAPLARGEDARAHVAAHHPERTVAQLTVEGDDGVGQHGDGVVPDVGVERRVEHTLLGDLPVCTSSSMRSVCSRCASGVP